MGLSQHQVLRRLEVEVGDPVVDQVDALVTEQQRFILDPQLHGIHDEAPGAARFEQLPRQQEFRVQVLAARVPVDDGDGPQRPVTAPQAPLGFEHGDDVVL